MALNRKEFNKVAGAVIGAAFLAGCRSALKPVNTALNLLDTLTPETVEPTATPLSTRTPKATETLKPTSTETPQLTSTEAMRQEERDNLRIMIERFYQGDLDLNGPNNAYRWVNHDGEVMPLGYMYESDVSFGEFSLETMDMLSVYLGSYLNNKGLLCLVWGQFNTNGEKLVWVNGVQNNPPVATEELSKILIRKSSTTPPMNADPNAVGYRPMPSEIVKILEPVIGRLVSIAPEVSVRFFDNNYCGKLTPEACVLYKTMIGATANSGPAFRDFLKGGSLEEASDIPFVLPPSEIFTRLDQLEYTLYIDQIVIPKITTAS